MSSLQIFDFSYNWNNKLSGTYFTTFRRHNPQKHKVGEQYEVWLLSKFLKKVEIVSIKTVKLKDVNDWIAALDTGYTLEEFHNIVKKMYKDSVTDWDTQLFDLVLLKTLKIKPQEKSLFSGN